jgi:hypothetical protein
MCVELVKKFLTLPAGSLVFTISATGLYQPVILVNIFTPFFATLMWLPGLHGFPHAVVTVHLGL